MFIVGLRYKNRVRARLWESKTLQWFLLYSNDSIAKVLQDLAGKPLKESSCAFIPTAANVEEGDKGWLIDDFNNLQNSGVSVDIVDISALPKNIWKPRLDKADILVIGGGNTFHLMYWIRKSGLDKLLPAYLKEKVYVGISAGSMVVSDNIFLTSDKPIFNENRFGITNDKGLNLINFYIRPHLNSPYFPKAKEGHIAKAAKSVTQPIYAIDDNTAVLFQNNSMKIISEGFWKVYNA